MRRQSRQKAKINGSSGDSGHGESSDNSICSSSPVAGDPKGRTSDLISHSNVIFVESMLTDRQTDRQKEIDLLNNRPSIPASPPAGPGRGPARSNDFGLEAAARTGDLVGGRLRGELFYFVDGLLVLCGRGLAVCPSVRRASPPPRPRPRPAPLPPTEVSPNTVCRISK